jgi:hypothetical protein
VSGAYFQFGRLPLGRPFLGNPIASTKLVGNIFNLSAIRKKFLIGKSFCVCVEIFLFLSKNKLLKRKENFHNNCGTKTLESERIQALMSFTEK